MTVVLPDTEDCGRLTVVCGGSVVLCCVVLRRVASRRVVCVNQAISSSTHSILLVHLVSTPCMYYRILKTPRDSAGATHLNKVSTAIRFPRC